MSTAVPTFDQSQSLRQRPEASPVMYQSWQRLLFLHWKYDPEVIQKLLPTGLTVDTFDGAAWVGVVPFLMRKIRPTWSPVVPYFSNFLELNVRTYAYDTAGTPGVWFFSLSANRLAAVTAARTFFHLPYVWSKMRAIVGDDRSVDYHCRQFRDKHRRSAHYIYRPIGQPAPAPMNTLEFFLAERYLLFARRGDETIATAQVHHLPYQLQPVEVEVSSRVPLILNGLSDPNRLPDHALYCEGVDVEVFSLKI